MFGGQILARPKRKSLLGALAATIVILFATQVSPVLGYLAGLSAMVMIVVALYMDSIWPTKVKKENALVFALFWGLMLGALVPFVVGVFIEGGFPAVLEMLADE